ncbi:MAG: hypothetical protein R2941_20775 [Desulfobacterales bacterium]
MRKNLKAFLIIGRLLIFVLAAGSSQSYALSLIPVDNFNDWQKAEPASQYIHSGNALSLSTAGKANIQKEYADGMGILCTFNIESASGTASGGLAMDAGYMGNDKLHVNLGISKWGDNYSVYYQIQRRDVNNNIIEELAYGGQIKAISNPNLVIGIARVANEIWLYADGYSLIKWDPLTAISPAGSRFWLWGGTDQNPGSSITATFSNVGIIYP